jgi:hypothetical protein
MNASTVRSLRVPALLAGAGLVALIPANLVRIVLALLVDGPSKPAGDPVASSTSVALAVADWWYVPLVLYTIVTFLVWLYLARVNLDRNGFFRLRWRPAWTVASWFVPVVNIYLPPLVLGEVYRHSETRALPTAPLPRIVLAWWLAFLLGWLRITVTERYPDGTVVTHGVATWEIANGVFGTVAAVLAIVMVRRITGWQAAWVADAVPAQQM